MPTTTSTAPSLEDASQAPRKLKILCLHGYHGSARTLRSQMAGFASALGAMADFVYVDAPSLAVGDYGWWHAVDAERDPASDDPGVDGPRRHYKGWSRSRDAIVSIFETQGPFDGVLGFSQGAALAGLLVGLRAPDGKKTGERPLVFDFAIVVSGFASNDPELARLYARHDSYAAPSVHIMGTSDGIVSNQDSRALAADFTSPTLIEHSGGHVVPSEARVVDRVRAFLTERTSARSTDDAGTMHGMISAPIDVPLWNKDTAATVMRVVFPDRPRGKRVPALVVFRGGAYATSHGSGAGSIEWAAKNGMVGVEVSYRCQETGDAYPKSYADAARAVRIVRARADEWGIDTARVGVLGFSAGGHLASLLSTQPGLYVDPADDLASHIDPRPDFVILGYPVISFSDAEGTGAYVGTMTNFFGRRDVDERLRRQFSNELHVTPKHPPVFVWTTEDDSLVPASHSRLFAEACQHARVPVSFTMFAHGPHGMGLALDAMSDVRTWTEKALGWLISQSILERP